MKGFEEFLLAILIMIGFGVACIMFMVICFAYVLPFMEYRVIFPDKGRAYDKGWYSQIKGEPNQSPLENYYLKSAWEEGYKQANDQTILEK